MLEESLNKLLYSLEREMLRLGQAKLATSHKEKRGQNEKIIIICHCLYDNNVKRTCRSIHFFV